MAHFFTYEIVMAKANVIDIFKCRPSQVKEYVIRCLSAGLVPFIQGSPGIGKSAIIHKIADEFNLQVIDVRLSQCDPVDLQGLPHFDNAGNANFVPFDTFPIENRPLPLGKDGWLLFLDEFNSASKAVQAAAYKLVLDRMVGQHKLHNNCLIVTAGNLATDRAIVNQLSTAMQSRLVHIEMEVNKDDWIMDVAIPYKYDERIVAYISAYPDELMNFQPDHQDKTFACPRTWQFVNALIKERDVADNDIPLLGGAIGTGVAAKFVQFTKVYKTIDSIHKVIKDPMNATIPQRNDLKWAMISHLTQNVDEKNIGKVIQYVMRFEMPFQTLFFRMTMMQNPALQGHPDVIGMTVQMAKHLSRH